MHDAFSLNLLSRINGGAPARKQSAPDVLQGSRAGFIVKAERSKRQRIRTWFCDCYRFAAQLNPIAASLVRLVGEGKIYVNQTQGA